MPLVCNFCQGGQILQVPKTCSLFTFFIVLLKRWFKYLWLETGGNLTGLYCLFCPHGLYAIHVTEFRGWKLEQLTCRLAALSDNECFSISLLVSSLLCPPSYDLETNRAQLFWRTFSIAQWKDKEWGGFLRSHERGNTGVSFAEVFNRLWMGSRLQKSRFLKSRSRLQQWILFNDSQILIYSTALRLSAVYKQIVYEIKWGSICSAVRVQFVTHAVQKQNGLSALFTQDAFVARFDPRLFTTCLPLFWFQIQMLFFFLSQRSDCLFTQ